MERSIEIKRRAQRFILNRDLDGALSEYEKLVASGDSDPYHSVLLADLLYKKGDAQGATRRYLEAVDGYEKAGLYKNAIAVCKKMLRLSFAPGMVLKRLASLHALDGLATESSLYYMQHADVVLQVDELAEARASLRRAFEVCPDNIKALERLAEAEAQAAEPETAARTLAEAASRYQSLNQFTDARRCLERAEKLSPGAARAAIAALRPGLPGAQAGGAPSVPLGNPLPGASLPGPTPREGKARAESAGSRGERPPQAFPSLPGPPRQQPAARARGAGQTEADVESGILPPPAAEFPSGLRFDAPPPPQRGASSRPPQDTSGEAEVMRIERFQEVESTPVGRMLPLEEPGEDSAELEAAEVTDSLEPEAEAEELEAEEPEAGEPEAEEPEAEEPEAGEPEAEEPEAEEPEAEEEVEEPAAEESEASLSEISALLKRAQAMLRAGDREGASTALVRAAQAYDGLGRLDNAAAIYRGLRQVSGVSLQVMLLWLKNCQRRDDRQEASRVAADLGDRSLAEADVPGAREWFERARAFDDQNEVAAARLKRLAGGSEGTGRSPLPAGGSREAAVPRSASQVSQEEWGDDEEDPSEAQPKRPGVVQVAMSDSGRGPIELGQMISEFQRGVEAQLAGDPQAHYDLGMSYYDMRLMEQAIDSFRLAGNDPALLVRSVEMIGRCLLDQGMFEEATEELRAALARPDLAAEAVLDLRFQLGIALEASGEAREALEQFERVYAAEPSYPDVAIKIRGLRKTVEIG